MYTRASANGFQQSPIYYTLSLRNGKITHTFTRIIFNKKKGKYQQLLLTCYARKGQEENKKTAAG